MKLNEILMPSFRDCQHPVKPMVTVEYDSDFCLWATDGSRQTDGKPILTEAQMRHAAERYRLGKSKSGKTIFWMTDEQGIVRDGHLGNDWVSRQLKDREPELLRWWHPEHCLFGLHLLGHTDTTDSTEIKGHTEITETTEIKFSNPLILDEKDSCSRNNSFCDFRDFCVTNKPVSIVESERSAVVLSEIFPENIWLATAYPANLRAEILEPLQGCETMLFPPTDPTGETFMAWLETADQARHSYGLNITVSSILEDKTTPEQKSRYIDLLDYMLEVR